MVASIGYIDSARSGPVVCARIVSAAGVELTRVVRASPDDNLAAVPMRYPGLGHLAQW